MCLLTSRRSACPRAQVGCVIVGPDNHVLRGLGYNGAPAGSPNCFEAGCLMHEGHCIRTLHAEENAVLNSHGDLQGCIAYVSHFPCHHCVTLLAAAGIRRVIYLEEYGNRESQAASIRVAIQNMTGLFAAAEVLKYGVPSL